MSSEMQLSDIMFLLERSLGKATEAILGVPTSSVTLLEYMYVSPDIRGLQDETKGVFLVFHLE